MSKRLFVILFSLALTVELLVTYFVYFADHPRADSLGSDTAIQRELQKNGIKRISGMVVSCDRQQMAIWGKDANGQEHYISKIDISTGKRIMAINDYNQLKAKGAISPADLDFEKDKRGKVVTTGLWPPKSPKYAVLKDGSAWRKKHPSENVKFVYCISENYKGSNTTPMLTSSASNGTLSVRGCPSTGCISKSSSDANMGPNILVYGSSRGLLIHGKIPDVSFRASVPQTHGCVRLHNATLATLFPYMKAGVAADDLKFIIRAN